MALKTEAIGREIGPLEKTYSWKDVVLYALGVGAGFDELQYCYEEKLQVIPSFSIGAVFDFLAAVAMESGANLAGILHGEQDILFHAAIPTQGKLRTTGAITKMLDRGERKGALVVAEADTWHDGGARLFTNKFTLFSRLDGGFGGEAPEKEDFAFPDRKPDFVQEDRPGADQPLLYRLSGDIFALHADPDFARSVGFEKPIMHGLCTHGFACRAVISHLFPEEPHRMTRFKTRFSKPLYPGLPIRTEIWKTAEGEGVFRTVNAESGEVVIDRGVVEWADDEGLRLREKRQGIRFDDRVAVVTGAGAGLGRVYALELAARGCKVVVNDLGGAADGRGDSKNAADAVVEEIRQAGGEAVASYDSVATPEGGEAIINAALSAFGRIDIVINNAGILRDRSFVKLGPEDWKAVLDVHLAGAYHVTRPAFAKMREQGYGRIVFTTSAAGLFGNFGQTNYSAAKLGLVGLMNSLKLEGLKYDIKVNTVAPIARTRLTEDILPPDLLERMRPEFVAPLVLYLCSKECPVTGSIYNAGMGYYNRSSILTGPGAVVGAGEIPTPDTVAAALDAIGDMENAREYHNLTEALNPMIDAFESGPAEANGGGSSEPGGVAAIFKRMPEAFQADKSEGVSAVFQYVIGGDGGGEWFVTVKEQTCSVQKGRTDAADTTIKMDGADFLALMQGKANAMNLFTTGKLKVEGDMMKSQLIGKLFRF